MRLLFSVRILAEFAGCVSPCPIHVAEPCDPGYNEGIPSASRHSSSPGTARVFAASTAFSSS